MSSLREYRFTSIWRVRANVEEAYAALHDLASYPAWWPEVKEAKRIDDKTFWLRCRSTLPYDLIFETAQALHSITLQRFGCHDFDRRVVFLQTTSIAC